MTLTQLRYILAVDHHRHFGKAAEACHVAQPSLSTQIQKLEDDLGVRIFERDKNTCVPTEVGKELIKQARLILDESARMEDIVASYSKEVKGTLKLGIIPTIAPFLLPSLIPAVQKKYPELKLEIFEQKTADLVSLIEGGEIDAAILSTPKVAPATLKEKVLYYEPFVLFAAKTHPLRKVSNVTVDDLEHYAPFLLDDTHCLRDQVEKLCQIGQTSEGPLHIKAGSLHTLVEVVSSSGGYTLLPSLAQEFFKKTYPDSFREMSEPKPSRKVSLVFHRSFLKRPLIEAVTGLISENLPSRAIPVERKAQTKVIDPDKGRF